MSDIDPQREIPIFGQRHPVARRNDLENTKPLPETTREPGLDTTTGEFPLVSVRGTLVAIPVQASPIRKRARAARWASRLGRIHRWLSRMIDTVLHPPLPGETPSTKGQDNHRPTAPVEIRTHPR